MAFACIDTPIGRLKIVEAGGTVVRIAEMSPQSVCDENDGGSLLLGEVCRQIDAYFQGKLKEFDFPFFADGTDFQKAVWAECRKIPYGSSKTYGEIAREIGSSGASRAVGAALGRNPLLLVVPCHRVTARNGAGGFRLGSVAKSFLSELEGN